MNREYHKGYSRELHRDMDSLVFGHAGTPPKPGTFMIVVVARH
jgi:esterase/lipase superfamily enzyme